MHWPNPIRCLKSLENLLSAKPILRRREVPAQETKDSDGANDTCLSNTRWWARCQLKEGGVGLTKLKVAAVAGEIMT